MRKRVSLAGIIGLLLIIIVVVIGCGRGGASPSSVIRQLYTAIERGNTAAINELMVQEAAGMMIMFLSKAQEGLAEQGGIESTEETIDGDTASVIVTFRDGSTQEYDLVRVDGKWKVTFNNK